MFYESLGNPGRCGLALVGPQGTLGCPREVWEAVGSLGAQEASGGLVGVRSGLGKR